MGRNSARIPNDAKFKNAKKYENENISKCTLCQKAQHITVGQRHSNFNKGFMSDTEATEATWHTQVGDINVT